MDVHDTPPAAPAAAPHAALDALFATARRIEVPAGAWAFRGGEASRELVRVESGTVDVVLPGADGREQTLARLGPGVLFGEVSFLLGGARSAGVRARERTVLRAIDRADVPPEAEAEVGFALAAVLAQRLRSTNALLTDLMNEDDLDAPRRHGQVEGAVDRVAVREEITLDDLRALLDGRLLAVRVPRWYTPRQCHQLARRLLRHPGFSRYSVAPDVGVQRVGFSYFETTRDPEREARYFEQAVPTIRELRAVCAPLLLPTDRLRLELDELWPGGCQLATLDGKKMFVGVARMFEDGHSLPAHQDILHRETDAALARALSAQLTANVYIATPRSGGELELWDAAPTDAEALALYTGTHDFLDLERLGPPAARIAPGTGELVLMLSSRVHAVGPSVGGPRISLSCFAGVIDEARPMVAWN